MEKAIAKLIINGIDKWSVDDEANFYDWIHKELEFILINKHNISKKFTAKLYENK